MYADEVSTCNIASPGGAGFRDYNRGLHRIWRNNTHDRCMGWRLLVNDSSANVKRAGYDEQRISQCEGGN